MMQAPMIGSRRHTGPGGRSCVCCNVAPGKPRRLDRRTAKRAERAAWKRELSSY